MMRVNTEEYGCDLCDRALDDEGHCTEHGYRPGGAARPLSQPVAGMTVVEVWAWTCHRCEHVWLPRELVEPRVCPKCKSPYWNRPRRS